MAEVRLGRYEMETGNLPAVCLVCGAPATMTTQQKMSWRPPDEFSFGDNTRKITIAVPVCDAHVGHWSRRARCNRFYMLFLLAVLAVIVLCSLLSSERDKGIMILSISLIVILPLIIIWGIVNIVFDSFAIKTTEIGEHSVTLKGVSESFVDALDEARARMPGKRQQRRDEE